MKHGQKKDSTQSAVFGVIAVAVVINTLLVVMWDVMAPFKWTIVTIVRDDFGEVISSIGMCQTTMMWEFAVVFVVYFFSLILIGNFISWKTKSLPSKYQESKWIAYSMISNFQVFAIGLPLMLLTGACRVCLCFSFFWLMFFFFFPVTFALQETRGMLVIQPLRLQRAQSLFF
jgi:hypothetical protein